MKLKDVYALPSGLAALTEWVLRPSWFPELTDLGHRQSSELFEKLEKDGRLLVREIIYQHTGDGDRHAAMYSVWFDGKPVFFVQNAGRGGRDHQSRWVTDYPLYLQLLAYLLPLVQDEPHDVFDPEQEVFTEEIFSFYGNDFSSQFGYENEPVTLGYMFLGDVKGFIRAYPALHYLVVATSGIKEAPKFIRRGAFVMEYARDLNEDDLAKAKGLKEARDTGEYSGLFVYKAANINAGKESVISI